MTPSFWFTLLAAMGLTPLCVVNWYVALSLVRLSHEQRDTRLIFVVALTELCIAIATTAVLIVGINSLVGAFDGGSGFLPSGAGIFTIAVAFYLISSPNLYLWRLLRR